MTTAQAVALGVPRWMVLAPALADDVDQICALADLEFATAAQRRAARDYYLHELRRTQWDRTPRRPAKRPHALRPSKLAVTTGYRTDSAAHITARGKVEPQYRAEIARKGAQAKRIEQ